MPRGFNDYDTARIQGRLWTPDVLRPDVWFDAADLSTISVSTGVSEWRDKSGNARHMSQSTSSDQPLLEIEKKNGLSTVYVKPYPYAPSGSVRNYDTWIEMAASLSVQSAYCALYRNSCLTNQNSFIFTDSSQYDWHSESGNTALAHTVNAGGNWRSGNNWRNGESITVTSQDWVDSWSIFSFHLLGGVQTRGIGKDRTYHGSKGSYGEILWFSGAKTNRERYNIEGYLSWKWGIPLAADHPYAARPPLIGE